MSSGPQKIKNAALAVESIATTLLGAAHRITAESAPWEHRDLLKMAREYAAAVNRLTRVRK